MAVTHDDIYRIAFSSIRGMGYELAQKLLDVVGDEHSFFGMSEAELRAITGSKSKVWSKAYRDERLATAHNEADFVERNGIRLIYFDSADYPKRFDGAPDAPIMLYALGDCDLNGKHIISIVGTRKATEYGAHFCSSLIEGLSEMLDDAVIVSGLAFGTDINAHRAAMHYGVPTVAVLAGGLNKIYPSQHRGDAARIAKGAGMVLTEYTSRDEMHKANFLARNRIIAALADCTVVLESAKKGGALVTASIASSYGRDVFALPGRATDTYSAGCNRLIVNNQAAAITSAEELLRHMRWLDVAKNKNAYQRELFPELDDEEQNVLELLARSGDTHINVIAEQMAMPVYRVMAMLVELDCKGMVMSLPGSRYAAINNK